MGGGCSCSCMETKDNKAAEIGTDPQTLAKTIDKCVQSDSTSIVTPNSGSGGLQQSPEFGTSDKDPQGITPGANVYQPRSGLLNQDNYADSDSKENVLVVPTSQIITPFSSQTFSRQKSGDSNTREKEMEKGTDKKKKKKKKKERKRRIKKEK